MTDVDQSNWLELQNMYEMGLIGRTEFEKQRDMLLADGADLAEPAAPQTNARQAAAPVAAPQQQPPAKAPRPQEPQEDFQEGIVESAVDANGVKTVTEYRINEQGQRVKTVRTVKLVKQQRQVKKSVLARRKVPKFGRCAGMAPGPESGVTSFGDLVSLEVPTEEKKVEKKESSLNYTVSCRSCGAIGDHWTMACPYKDRLLDFDDLLAGGDGQPSNKEGEEAAGEALSSGKPGKYRPPGARDGGSTGSQMPDDRAKEISCTVRVTNLSEDTGEQDVRDLFSRFGNLQRVYLARNKITQQSRGFAFVSFYNRRDAEKAIETLQGYGYDNLILRLEFAASSGPGGGPGGGGDRDRGDRGGDRGGERGPGGGDRRERMRE